MAFSEHLSYGDHSKLSDASDHVEKLGQGVETMPWGFAASLRSLANFRFGWTRGLISLEYTHTFSVFWGVHRGCIENLYSLVLD